MITLSRVPDLHRSYYTVGSRSGVERGKAKGPRRRTRIPPLSLYFYCMQPVIFHTGGFFSVDREVNGSLITNLA